MALAMATTRWMAMGFLTLTAFALLWAVTARLKLKAPALATPAPSLNTIVTFSSFRDPHFTLVLLRSFQRHVPNARLVILTNASPEQSQVWMERAQRYGATVHGARSMFKDAAALAWVRPGAAKGVTFNNVRLIVLRRWLQEHPMPPETKVMMSDEDLAFLRDPFEPFPSKPGPRLYAFAEKTGVYNDRVKSYVTNSVSNTLVKDHLFQDTQMYCFGVVMGNFAAITALLARLVTMFMTNGIPAGRGGYDSSDQGAFNVLIHTGLLEDLNLQRVSNEDMWAVHLTSQLGDLGQKWPTYLEKARVVHQYKWFERGRAHFYHTYNMTCATPACKKVHVWDDEAHKDGGHENR